MKWRCRWNVNNTRHDSLERVTSQSLLCSTERLPFLQQELIGRYLLRLAIGGGISFNAVKLANYIDHIVAISHIINLVNSKVKNERFIA